MTAKPLNSEVHRHPFSSDALLYTFDESITTCYEAIINTVRKYRNDCYDLNYNINSI